MKLSVLKGFAVECSVKPGTMEVVSFQDHSTLQSRNISRSRTKRILRLRCGGRMEISWLLLHSCVIKWRKTNILHIMSL